MIKRRTDVLLLLMFGMISVLTGCWYQHIALLHPPRDGQTLSQKDVSVRIKAMRDFECLHYFDSRLVSKGIQPIQVYVHNDSDNVLVLDAAKVSVPLVSKRSVTGKIYKRVFPRILVWTAGIAFLWKVFVPVLIIDTLFSIQANQEVKQDIESVYIAPREKVVIQPRSRMHRVLFVSKDDYHHHLSVTLEEKERENELVYTF